MAYLSVFTTNSTLEKEKRNSKINYVQILNRDEHKRAPNKPGEGLTRALSASDFFNEYACDDYTDFY